MAVALKQLTSWLHPPVFAARSIEDAWNGFFFLDNLNLWDHYGNESCPCRIFAWSSFFLTFYCLILLFFILTHPGFLLYCSGDERCPFFVCSWTRLCITEVRYVFIVSWKIKTTTYITVQPLHIMSGWEKTIRILREVAEGQETDHKQSASFGMNLDEPFPDEAINCKMPHFGGSVLSLLWAGKWETECLSGSIAISSSNCMIGIFNSGLCAPIKASFRSWFKLHCASRSVYLWHQTQQQNPSRTSTDSQRETAMSAGRDERGRPHSNLSVWAQMHNSIFSGPLNHS